MAIRSWAAPTSTTASRSTCCPRSSANRTSACAAIIADTLHSDRRVQLADILPGTIRVGEPNGSTRVLFERGARLPVETEFEAPAGVGAQIRIPLYRGDAERADENTFLAAVVFP